MIGRNSGLFFLEVLQDFMVKLPILLKMCHTESAGLQKVLKCFHSIFYNLKSLNQSKKFINKFIKYWH